MKTKFSILFTIIFVAAIGLAGCSSAAAATATSSSKLSAATQLAVGTLKLEGSSNAVTTAQATQLVTLWEAYESMSTSDTTSQVELEALVNQIEGVMTADQLKAIDGMSLTEQSVDEIMQSATANSNLSTNAASTSASSGTTSSGSSNTASSSNQGGPAGAPAGAPSGMPGGSGGDSVMSAINGTGTSAQSTPAATQSTTNSSSTQVNPMVLQALIQMLKTRGQTSG